MDECLLLSRNTSLNYSLPIIGRCGSGAIRTFSLASRAERIVLRCYSDCCLLRWRREAAANFTWLISTTNCGERRRIKTKCGLGGCASVVAFHWSSNVLTLRQSPVSRGMVGKRQRDLLVTIFLDEL